MSDSERPKSYWWKCIMRIIHILAVPFVWIERFCKWLSVQLKPCAFLKVMEYAGRLTVLVAVIFYIMGRPERQMQSRNLRMQVKNLEQQLANQQKAKHYQAWQVINSAQGKPGNGGRIDALQDLHRDGIWLMGVDISNANLPALNLAGANLIEANLAGASIAGANLAGAKLVLANFAGANLDSTNLAGAILWKTNLAGAMLWETNLTEAIMEDANLSGAKLEWANLTGADLANIQNWRQIKSIEFANISGVKNAPNGFIEWAKENGAVSIENPKEWDEFIEEKIRGQVLILLIALTCLQKSCI
jgi:hypothetical protein